MDKIKITGGVPLQGEIRISGAKNAALPLMCASLLTAETLALSNMPALADIATMEKLLARHGVEIPPSPLAGEGWGGVGALSGDKISTPPPPPPPPNPLPQGEGEFGGPFPSSHLRGEGGITFNASRITDFTAPYELVRTMRASVLVLGPLLARFGEAKVSLPGGCAIGTRPIDLHLHALELMGAEIELSEGYVKARAPKGLKGALIQFDKVSVGATENILMAACLANGETIIRNAAREPEVNDLAECLIKMGADISGVGCDELRVRGVAKLHGAEHAVIADRIETGTYAAAAAITGGEVELLGARPETLGAVIEKFHESGIEITPTARGLRVKRANGQLEGVDIMTQPYPGYPTDMQAQMMALMSMAKGASMITETIFENRFMHVPELTRMGARINVHGSSAMIRGSDGLTGAEVMATDLRASSSLIIAALAAKGETVINRVYHLDRGYEKLEEKLSACGAKVERITG